MTFYFYAEMQPSLCISCTWSRENGSS